MEIKALEDFDFIQAVRGLKDQTNKIFLSLCQKKGGLDCFYKKKKKDNIYKLSESFIELESLILAQDERWRHA